MAFFSVVIPLFNKQDQIESTIDYVLAQSFGDFELIVIDDGSTDNSYKIASSYSDERLILIKQVNQGAGATRNRGVALAKGKFIAFLDADDIWRTNHLQCLYDSITKFPDKNWYSNAYEVRYSSKLTVAHQFSKPTPVQISVVDDFFINSLSIPLVNTSSVAIRTRELKELGGFKKTIVSGQDIDLWIRLGLKEPLVFNEMYTSIYDKTVSNSLSKENHQESKYQLFKSYEAAATSNNSLKIYLNSLKYSLAIQCVLSNNGETFKKIKKELDYSSLNWKQKLLLKQPKTLTKILKKIHTLLKAKGLYISSYA